MPIIFILCFLGAGCANLWHTESFKDRRDYAVTEATAAAGDEVRIIRSMPTIGFRRDDHPVAGMPETEAVFIRSDNDHFHITVTIRCLVRVDQPGFVTTVQVESYNVGEEGAIQAAKSVLNEIDQLYRRGA